MKRKNAALCSAEHTESISGLSIKQGIGGECGGEMAWEQLSEASLFLSVSPSAEFCSLTQK